jgi:hypothetical protein
MAKADSKLVAKPAVFQKFSEARTIDKDDQYSLLF